jgi:hypothetical protein
LGAEENSKVLLAAPLFLGGEDPMKDVMKMFVCFQYFEFYPPPPSPTPPRTPYLCPVLEFLNKLWGTRN